MVEQIYKRTQTRAMTGKANFLGLWSLYLREIKRFSKIYMQTFFAPIIAALLFLSILTLAFRGEGRSAPGIEFSNFITPGLILMALMTSCFANSSFALMFEKLTRVIADTLTPPLSPLEIVLGYLLASATRGIFVAVLVSGGVYIFFPFTLHSPFILTFFCLASAILMSLAGIITGLWAEKVDHVASINNFIVLPLTFLSGTFFSIKYLPDWGLYVTLINPVFYMIDGFRYGWIGYSDRPVFYGIIILTIINIALFFICIRMFKVGYNLKS
jgi:ABC-2 type transport system permease protein